MAFCNHCGSSNTIKRGFRLTAEGKRQEHQCKSCGKRFVESVSVGEECEEIKATNRKFVVTCAINNTEVNERFMQMLENYCQVNSAMLMIVGIKYRNPSAFHSDLDDEIWWDDRIKPYMIDENLVDSEFKFKVLGKIKIQATAESPLSGLDSLTRGMNTIVGHPQLQMKTLPVFGEKPVILTTTGAVTQAVFSETKAGYKAEFNHSLSAIVVECDDEIGYSHIRQLHFSNDGIIDINRRYTEDQVLEVKGSGLVVGDEHVMFHSPDVMACTYTNEDSIVKTISPSVIVRHDVLDCYSISHHHRKNFVLQYKKRNDGQHLVLSEVMMTARHIQETTPEGCDTYVVSSNHNEHLLRWLNESDPKKDINNAKTYHALMYRVLDYIDRTGEIPDPFALLCEHQGQKTKFISRNESLEVFGIEVGNHGDHGFNGSRGSRNQYAKLPVKTVIGHSHSPGIEKGCYQVGTSSVVRLEYNKGPSSWANTHCIIHPNGKRQLITIIEGKWRA